MNRDTFTNVSLKDAANCSMAVIDRLQKEPAAHQMAAITATFLLACERHGITPGDAFTITKNVMNHAEGRRPEFAAVAMYMENEW